MAEPTVPAPLHAVGAPAFRPDPTHHVLPDVQRMRAQALLERVPLFAQVQPHHLREIARYARTEMFAVGEVIIRMGEPGASMYIIRSGRAEVVRDVPGEEPLVLATLGPGEFFGELSIFDREMRSATVRAVDETETVTLGQFDIIKMVTHSPQMALSLLKSLTMRLRATDERLSGTLPPAGPAPTA